MTANTVLPALTGDPAQTVLYVVIAVLALAAVLVMTFKDKIGKKK